MKHTKKCGAAALAALLAAPPISGQSALTASQTQALFYVRDVSAAAYEYCIMAGAGGGALDKSIESRIPIVTAGSSTTTTAKVAGTKPFLAPNVGDEITLAPGVTGLKTFRYVVTNADDDTITVDTAWDLGTAGVPFYWRDLTCGNAASNGIISTAGRETVTFDIQILTINATSIDFQVEGRNPGAGTGWTPLTTAAYTAVGGGIIIVNRTGFNQLRLGVKVTGDVGAQSVTAKVVVL